MPHSASHAQYAYSAGLMLSHGVPSLRRLFSAVHSKVLAVVQSEFHLACYKDTDSACCS